MLYVFFFAFSCKRVKAIALDVIETIRMSHISDLLADSQIEYRMTIGVGLRGDDSRFPPGMQGGSQFLVLSVEF